jgi:hypothetical protein
VRRILVDARVPDGVELHGTELARGVENPDAARASKLATIPTNPRTRPSKDSSGPTLSAADREKIAHGNAERLLRIS